MSSTTAADHGVTTEPLPAVDVTHPDWCEQSAGCVNPDHPDRLEHRQRATTWAVTGDDVELTLTLERGDELFRGTQLIGETAALLSVLNLAAIQANGSPIFADVRLTADDIDVLITFLRRHAAQLRHPQHFEMPQEAGA